MADEHSEEHAHSQTLFQLQGKPQRRRRFRWPFLALLLGGVILVSGLFTVGWQSLQIGNGTTTSPVSLEPTKPAGADDPPVYYQTVEQYMSKQLQMSVEQIKAKLQAGGRSASLVALGAAEGISVDQMHTSLLDAEQHGHDVLVRLGYLTQQQSDQGMASIRAWDLATLDRHIRDDFLYHS